MEAKTKADVEKAVKSFVKSDSEDQNTKIKMKDVTIEVTEIEEN